MTPPELRSQPYYEEKCMEWEVNLLPEEAWLLLYILSMEPVPHTFTCVIIEDNTTYSAQKKETFCPRTEPEPGDHRKN